MKTSFRQLSREEDACKQLSKCENQNSTISIVVSSKVVNWSYKYYSFRIICTTANRVYESGFCKYNVSPEGFLSRESIGYLNYYEHLNQTKFCSNDGKWKDLKQKSQNRNKFWAKKILTTKMIHPENFKTQSLK